MNGGWCADIGPPSHRLPNSIRKVDKFSIGDRERGFDGQSFIYHISIITIRVAKFTNNYRVQRISHIEHESWGANPTSNSPHSATLTGAMGVESLIFLQFSNEQ